MCILILNGFIENCGVCQYGKRVGSILKKSKRYNIIYSEPKNIQEYFEIIEKTQPKVVIYNYLPATVPFLNNNFFIKVKQKNIKQGLIIHNGNTWGVFDFFLHQNPEFVCYENNKNLLRPLIEKIFDNNLPEYPLRIGSFGFFGLHKKINKMCRYINEQMDVPTEINLHITRSFLSHDEEFEKIKNDCFSEITRDNIKLNITKNFLTDDELLLFLNNNHLNMFLYDDYNFYNGISSSIDYALSCKRPIAICKSNMFLHLKSIEDKITIENNSLNDIINNGIHILKPFYEKWSNVNFIQKFENDVEEYYI